VQVLNERDDLVAEGGAFQHLRLDGVRHMDRPAHLTSSYEYRTKRVDPRIVETEKPCW